MKTDSLIALFPLLFVKRRRMLFLLLLLDIVVASDLASMIDHRCPCVETDLCLVRTSYTTFSAFQEAAPRCSQEKVRCCSEGMMVLSLVQLQRTGGLRRQGRQKKFNSKDLPCTLASECSQVYGTEAFHFIHISNQGACAEPDEVRCVVPKLTEESSLPCILQPICVEIFGTKSQHFQKYGFMTACKVDHVRCLRWTSNPSPPPSLAESPNPTEKPETDLESIVITSAAEETTKQPPVSVVTITTAATAASTSSPCSCCDAATPGTIPDLDSIVITSSPVEVTTTRTTTVSTTTLRPGQTPDLEAIVITSDPEIVTRPTTTLNPGQTSDLESIVVTSSPIKVTTSKTTLKPGFSPVDLESIVITSSPVKATTKFTISPTSTKFTGRPDLESVVVTSRPSLSRPVVLAGEDLGLGAGAGQIILGEDPPGPQPPSVQIIGPRPVYFQVTNVRGPVIGGNSDQETQELKILLKLARDRLKAYIDGK